MPSSNINRAIGLYRVQATEGVSGAATTSARNEARRFNDQSRKTRSVLTGDSDEAPFEEVLRKVMSPKH